MKKENMYEALNNYLVRVPTFPLNYYINYFDEKTLYMDDLVKNNEFLESVQIASDNLYKALLRSKEGKTVTKKEQLDNSAEKYLVRMSTRPTPYGTFAGVSLGQFSDNTEVNYDINRMKKRARVDYGWIIEVIRKLDIDLKLYKKTKLFSNNMVLPEGDKLKNSCLTSYSDTKNKSAKIRINNSPNTRYILNLAKKGVYYDDIIKAFKAVNNNLDEKLVDSFIEDLIKKEYLITELRAPLTEFNQLEYVLGKINKYGVKDPIIDELSKINYSINKYNETKLGDGIEYLDEIRRLMIGVHDDVNLLQVDSRNKFDIKLQNDVKGEVEKVVNMLNVISYKEVRDNQWESFINEFIEKYGEYREVQIQELLDEFTGVPFEESSSVSGSGSDELEDKNYFIKNKIFDAIANEESEIIIKEEEIQAYDLEDYDIEDYFDTLEMYMHVVADNIEELKAKNYKIYIAPSFGSVGAGKSIGRFSDLLENVDKHYEEIKEKKDKLISNDYIRAELTSISNIPRMGNVTITQNYEDYQINLVGVGNDKKITIEIDDIYVGIYDQKLYIKSKSLNKKIQLNTNHMGTSAGNNKVYEFLVKIIEESNKIKPSSFIAYSDFKDFNYVPRIKYSKTIIHPATWMLNKRCVLSEKKDSKMFENWIEHNKKVYKMPKLIYLTEGDNRLLINTENDIQIKNLYSHIVKSKSNKFYFQEFEYNIKENWVANKGNYFESEFVFQLIKNKSYFKTKFDYVQFRNEVCETKSDVAQLKSNSSGNDEFRTVSILNDWIYFKLYLNNDLVDEIIGRHINDLVNELKSENLIDKHFYIRYMDNKSHIRLRVKSISVNNNNEIYIKFNRWQNRMMELKLIEKVVMDPYEKEIERYGGPKVIEYAEEFFDKQSTVIEEFYKLSLDKKIVFEKEDFALCNMVYIMDELGIDYTVQTALLERTFEQDLYRKEFRKDNNRYMNLCDSSNEWYNLKTLKYGEIVYELLNYQKETLNSLGDRIKEVDGDNELYNSKIDIIYSLLHMLCNRLLGIDKEKEKFIMCILRHSLYSLKYKKLKSVN